MITILADQYREFIEWVPSHHLRFESNTATVRTILVFVDSDLTALWHASGETGRTPIPGAYLALLIDEIVRDVRYFGFDLAAATSAALLFAAPGDDQPVTENGEF